MDAMRFLQSHAYLTVFFGLLLEYLGLPIPGELILLFVGAVVSWGRLELWVMLAVGLAAVLLGNHFWYFAGRRGGRTWLRWLCRATLGSAECISRAEGFFQRYGPASLLFAKFVPGLRTFAVPLAGMTGVAYVRFLVFDATGTLLWLSSVAWLGILTAKHFEGMVARIQHLGGALTLILALVALIVLILRLSKRLKYGPPALETKPGEQMEPQKTAAAQSDARVVTL